MNKLQIGINDLLSKYPSIAKEWHPTKNGDLKPEQFLPGSNKRVWWKCQICENEWDTRIDQRTINHTGCPKCKKEIHTSFPEQAIFYYLSKVTKAESRKIIGGFEADIYLNDLNVAIEYDGYYFHGRKNKNQYDNIKNLEFKKRNIRLIRIKDTREKINTFIKNETIFCHIDQKYSELNRVILILYKLLNIEVKNIDVTKDYQNIYQLYISLAKENSLQNKNPDLAKEWHPTKNGDLKPDNFQVSSSKYVWWLCPKCGHEWQSKISNRNRGKGCPACKQYAVTKKNNFLYLYPNLAKEWHPTKNGDLKPEQFLPGSNKRVWWIDSENNEWEAQINSRVRYKTQAKQKRGKRAASTRIDNLKKKNGSLESNYPNLAKEWCKERNVKLPSDFLSSSHTKVWWVCPLCNKPYYKEIRRRVANYNSNKISCLACRRNHIG